MLYRCKNRRLIENLERSISNAGETSWVHTVVGQSSAIGSVVELTVLQLVTVTQVHLQCPCLPSVTSYPSLAERVTDDRLRFKLMRIFLAMRHFGKRQNSVWVFWIEFWNFAGHMGVVILPCLVVSHSHKIRRSHSMLNVSLPDLLSLTRCC